MPLKGEIMMTRVFLAAGVAALAISAPGSGATGGGQAAAANEAARRRPGRRWRWRRQRAQRWRAAAATRAECARRRGSASNASRITSSVAVALPRRGCRAPARRGRRRMQAAWPTPAVRAGSVQAQSRWPSASRFAHEPGAEFRAAWLERQQLPHQSRSGAESSRRERRAASAQSGSQVRTAWPTASSSA